LGALVLGVGACPFCHPASREGSGPQSIRGEESIAEQDNVRFARLGFDAWNAHDPDAFISMVADDFVSESDTLPAPLRDRDGARQSMQMYIEAFPDLHFDIEQMIASGDYVVTRWHGTCRHDQAQAATLSRVSRAMARRRGSASPQGSSSARECR
jgi:predicted ester cyclase